MSGIIVGVDGSACSLRALDWALREGGIQHVPVAVFSVDHPATDRWGGGPLPAEADVVERARKRAREDVDLALDRIGAQSRPESITVTAVADPSPADVLQAAADDADLLVVGARGAGGFRLLRLGSVCTRLTHHARCPVVVIPPDGP